RIALAIFLMAVTPAWACNPDLISVQDWEVKHVERSGMPGASVSVTFTLNWPQPIRMIDASVQFQDLLGGYIGGVALDRDTRLSNGETTTDSGIYLGTDFTRIPEMERDDVMVTTCTRAVV